MSKLCPKCNAVHDKPGVFCSRGCANGRAKTAKQKEVMRVIMKSKYDIQPIDCICKICSKTFTKAIKNRVVHCCSTKCKKELSMITYQANVKYHKPMGGLRKGSGKGKSGYYNGWYLRSTYELAYVIYCLHHNRDIAPCKRCYRYLWNGKMTKYYPDFEVDGTIVEIKGIRSSQVNAKIASVTDVPIQILYKENLKDVFEWVVKHTGLRIQNLYRLYDTESKPGR